MLQRQLWSAERKVEQHCQNYGDVFFEKDGSPKKSDSISPKKNTLERKSPLRKKKKKGTGKKQAAMQIGARIIYIMGFIEIIYIV